MAPPAPVALAAPVITEPAHGFATTENTVHLAGTAPGAERVEVRADGVTIDIPVTTADGSFATDVDLPGVREYTLRVRAVSAADESPWEYVVLTREAAAPLPAPARPAGRRRAPGAPGDDDDDRSWWRGLPLVVRIILYAILAIIAIPLLIWFLILIVHQIGGTISSPATVSGVTNVGANQTVPSAPSNLTATAGSGGITLNWTPGSGNVSQYLVKRGGEIVSTQTGTTFTDSNVTPGTSYVYTVQAQGTGGTVSAPSNTVSATASSSSGNDTSGAGTAGSASAAPTPTPTTVAGGTGPITINQPSNVGMQAQITGGGALPTVNVIRLFVFAPGEGLYHPMGLAQVTSSGWSAQAVFGSTDPGDVGARYTLFAVELTPGQNDAVNRFHDPKLGGNVDAGYTGQQWQDNFAGGIKSRITVVRVR